MRALGVTLLTLVLLGFSHTASAQQADVSLFVDVWNDTDANGIIDDASETRLGDWTVEAYDESMTLLSQVSSSSTGLVELVTDPLVAYVCLLPQDDWLQTGPLSLVTHPLSIEWSCFDVSDEEETYSFSVVQISDETEPIPTIDEEENTPPTEKLVPEDEDEGAVLGATTPEVLAETGAPAALASVIGATTAYGALWLARRSKLD